MGGYPQYPPLVKSRCWLSLLAIKTGITNGNSKTGQQDITGAGLHRHTGEQCTDGNITNRTQQDNQEQPGLNRLTLYSTL